MSVTEAAWAKTACILCECNCGIEVAARWAPARAHPRRQGAPGIAGLHLQQGDPARPLPERPPPADLSAAPTRPTGASRRSTGTPRSPRSRSGSRRYATSTAARRSSTTAAAVRATTSAAATAARSCGARSRYRSERARAGEDGGVLRGRPHLRRHTRGDFEHAEVAVFVGKNPWQSQSFPRARVMLQEIANDPARVDGRARPGADRDRQAGRLPPARPAGHRRLVPRGAGRHDRAGGPRRPRVPGRAHQRVEPVLEAFARRRRRRLRALCGVDEDLDPRGRAAHRERRERLCVRGPRRSSSAPHSTLCSYLDKLLWLLTGNFGKPGGDARAHVVRERCSAHPRIRRTPVTGAPIIGGLVPCNVIPDEILTDHPDRFRAMIVESANPAHSLADSQRFARGVRGARAGRRDRRRR